MRMAMHPGKGGWMELETGRCSIFSLVLGTGSAVGDKFARDTVLLHG
jgi:hypothetical protein